MADHVDVMVYTNAQGKKKTERVAVITVTDRKVRLHYCQPSQRHDLDYLATEPVTIEEVTINPKTSPVRFLAALEPAHPPATSIVMACSDPHDDSVCPFKKGNKVSGKLVGKDAEGKN